MNDVWPLGVPRLPTPDEEQAAMSVAADEVLHDYYDTAELLGNLKIAYRKLATYEGLLRTLGDYGPESYDAADRYAQTRCFYCGGRQLEPDEQPGTDMIAVSLAADDDPPSYERPPLQHRTTCPWLATYQLFNPPQKGGVHDGTERANGTATAQAGSDC